MKKKNKPKTKVCNRCKKERSLKDFKHENREMLFGPFLWIHPWCNDCRLKVKIKWGGKKDGSGRKNRNTRKICKNKKENKHNISSNSRRRPNKKVHIQRVERTVSKPSVGKHKTTNLPRRTDPVLPKRGTGRVIKTLKQTKDYKGSI